ncbi:MAG: hypothetical protein LBP43_00080 [Treponema sp.]|nr:hypothetical protein [Treponema sp.]
MDDSDIGKTESFWALDIQTQSFYQISAVLLAENADCMVYAESDAQGKAVIDTPVAEGIAREYSQNIYVPMTSTFGPITHITKKNKVTFLLLDIRDGYDPAEESSGYVAGYFYPEDMEDRVNSNRRDMLYIDTNPGLLEMEVIYSTMAHELQHLINYSNTVLAKGREQDLWINEGLSTAAEYIYGGDPANRVIYYNEDWLRTILLGNNFFVWYGDWELGIFGDVLADYATVYLFFQWLRLHADNDTGIYKEIINSPYFDYRAVTETARNRIPALGLSGSFPESDWEKMLRTWMLANAIQSETGLLGYRKKISEITRNKVEKLETSYVPDTNRGSWEFSPGEGRFSKIVSSSYTPPAGSGSHIRYLGFNMDGAFDLTPPYEGKYLLTFNANANNRVVVYLPDDKMALLPGETGYLASSVGAAPAKETFGGTAASSRTAAGTSARPASYPVDAGFLIKKRQWEKSRAAAAAGVNPPGK